MLSCASRVLDERLSCDTCVFDYDCEWLMGQTVGDSCVDVRYERIVSLSYAFCVDGGDVGHRCFAYPARWVLYTVHGPLSPILIG